MKDVKAIVKGMSLREKIGQTGMPSPNAVKKGVRECGSYKEYFTKYPFNGFYVSVKGTMVNDDGSDLSESYELANVVRKTYEELDIPLFVAVDAEFGGKGIFPDMSFVPTNMALGAANDPELTYKRGYYWAKELKSSGINWAFGPVCDIMPSFFSGSIRCISDKTELITGIIPELIKGIQDGGLMACAKHYPGHAKDFRDAHFSLCTDKMTKAEWDKILRPIWQCAADSGVDSFMTAHPALPALDDSITRGKVLRPSSASPKTLGILRDEIGFDGIIITDAVGMKCIAAAFEHDDIYVECLKAGNDIVLFTGNDYIDVVEKAVLDGRISEEYIDSCVERVLRYKDKMGLFDGNVVGEPMTEEDKADFDKVNYEISKKGGTLLNNEGIIPFDKSKVKKASIVVIAPSEKFRAEIVGLQDAFAKHGIESEVVYTIESKSELVRMSEESQIIVYACYLASSDPYGFPGYTRQSEAITLLNGLSYGAEKSVVVSFGTPSVYYNYFETVDAYVNMYSSNKESMEAFVDGILGEFEFEGKSPVNLYPELA